MDYNNVDNKSELSNVLIKKVTNLPNIAYIFLTINTEITINAGKHIWNRECNFEYPL